MIYKLSYALLPVATQEESQGKNRKQADMGVPHLEIQVELNWQLNLQDGTCHNINFIQNPKESWVWQSTEQHGGTLHKKQQHILGGGGGTPYIPS